MPKNLVFEIVDELRANFDHHAVIKLFSNEEDLQNPIVRLHLPQSEGWSGPLNIEDAAKLIHFRNKLIDTYPNVQLIDPDNLWSQYSRKY